MIEGAIETWGPGAVLLASLLGSTHCVVMCGGLSAVLAPSRAQQVRYHLGRGLSYLGLGALSGGFGSILLSADSHAWISTGTAFLFGLGFVVMGAQLWRGKALHFSLIPRALLLRLHALARGYAFVGGMLTAFLPCGWLHGFVLAAATTRSSAGGAILLASFWLGTLPLLSGSSVVLKRALAPLARIAPRASALLLIFLGIFSVGSKISMLESPAHALAAERETGAKQSQFRCH